MAVSPLGRPAASPGLTLLGRSSLDTPDPGRSKDSSPTFMNPRGLFLTAFSAAPFTSGLPASAPGNCNTSSKNLCRHLHSNVTVQPIKSHNRAEFHVTKRRSVSQEVKLCAGKLKNILAQAKTQVADKPSCSLITNPAFVAATAGSQTDAANGLTSANWAGHLFSDWLQQTGITHSSAHTRVIKSSHLISNAVRCCKSSSAACRKACRTPLLFMPFAITPWVGWGG